VLKSNKLIGRLRDAGPERFILDRIKAIPAELKITFFSVIVLAALVHGFGFFNKFVNEDSLFHIGHSSLAYLYQSGRWMLVTLQFIRGFYAIPWIIGVFAVLYMALAVMLLVSILEIKNKLHCIIIAALIVAFPAWANQFMYDFMADAYPASMFLAVLAIYLTKKYKFGFVAGAFCLMLSLALYQSFLAFAIGLALMAMIRFILETPGKPKAILLYGSKFLLCGVLGLVLYFVSVSVSLLITGGALWDYQGLDTLGILSIGDLPRLLIDAYDIFLQGFRSTGGDVVSRLYVSSGLAVLYGIVFLLMAYLFIRLVIAHRVHRHIPAVLILLACLFLLPLGLNITAVTAPTAEFHTLMTNPFVLAVVLLFVFLDIDRKRKQAEEKKPGFSLALIGLCVTILISGNYMRQTSAFYFVQHMQYESTSAFYNRLLMRIESTEGYEPGMPVAIIGEAPFPYIGDAETLAAERWQIVGFSGMRPAVGLGEWNKSVSFIENFLGARIVAASQEQVRQIIESEAFADMPLYPRYGSVAVVDGVLVVKLNEVVE